MSNIDLLTNKNFHMVQVGKGVSPALPFKSISHAYANLLDTESNGLGKILLTLGQRSTVLASVVRPDDSRSPEVCPLGRLLELLQLLQ